MDKFSFDYRVTYADCTVGNHVYYARYLDILEAARGELFRAIGHPLAQYAEADLTFPVTECRLAYHRSARYDDLLQIHIGILRLERIRVGFGYQILKQADGGAQLITEAETLHVCCSSSDQPRRLPADLVQALRPFSLEPNPTLLV